MQIPLQISFHNLGPSDGLTALVRHRAALLEKHFPRLVGCKVSIEEPNHHHRHGKGRHFRVIVGLTVPGETLVASREAPSIVSHEDAYRAISQTFDAAVRQLDAFAGRRDGHAKPYRRPKNADRPWLTL